MLIEFNKQKIGHLNSLSKLFTSYNEHVYEFVCFYKGEIRIYVY